MPHLGCRALAASAAIVALAPAAHADRALSLDEALRVARAHNRDLQAARARLDQAAVVVEDARAALLPTVSAQGRYTHNYKEVAIDFSAIIPGAMPAVIQKAQQLDAGITGTVPLVVPSAYEAVGAAHATTRAAAAQYDVTETSILFGVAQAYFAAAGTDELLTARANAVAVAKETYANAKARVAADLANQVDVTRAEAALVRAEQARTSAANLRATAYRSLATLLGTHEQLTAKPADPAARPALAEPTDALVAAARARRPELVVDREQIEAHTLTARAEAWRWAPTLSAFGNLRGFNYTGFSGDKYSWAVGLELDWVLYDGGLRDAQRHLAQAQRREVEAELDLLGDTIADDVADARGALETSLAAEVAATREAALAGETLRLIRAQYDAGTTRQLDVLAAQDSLVEAEVALARAHFDRALAEIALARATGAFPGRGTVPR